jgi:hypothetical protein
MHISSGVQYGADSVSLNCVNIEATCHAYRAPVTVQYDFACSETLQLPATERSRSEIQRSSKVASAVSNGIQHVNKRPKTTLTQKVGNEQVRWHLYDQ